jgi:hypothetical protein
LDWIISNSFRDRAVGRLMDDHDSAGEANTLADDICTD